MAGIRRLGRLTSFFFGAIGQAYAAAPSDEFIAGYAAGILKHDLALEVSDLEVRDGVVFLPKSSVDAAGQGRVVDLLSGVPGVKTVKIAESGELPEPSAPTAAADDASAVPQKLLYPTGLLPSGHLFKPLLADPRWPHFSAAYHNYQTANFDGKHIATVSFGETIPIYRANFGNTAAQWEAGLQAGVFSDFNLGASSSDLLNTDFIPAVYGSARAGRFSAFGRIYHQSSHLGDEFLLRKINTKFERVNLSYEGADLRLSYEFPYNIRLYGGGGGLFHKEPSNLKTWSAQYGIEFRSPWRLNFASLRPVVATDVKNFEENDWSFDVSVRAGVEFENFQVLNRKLQFLAEYYNGFAPSGQFYKNRIEYFGIGAHYHF